jgi:hypothetical protein
MAESAEPNIALVVNKYKKRPEQPDSVYANPNMDLLRREECLCINCDRKNEPKPYASCPVAVKIYNICVEHDMAMMITRCGATNSEGELLYKRLPK